MNYWIYIDPTALESVESRHKRYVREREKVVRYTRENISNTIITLGIKQMTARSQISRLRIKS